MSTRLILFKEGTEEFIVIDTQDLDDKQLREEYGGAPQASIRIADSRVSLFPTDRALVDETK